MDSTGTVTFKGMPDANSSAVTIRATEENKPGTGFSYAFTIEDWYINNDSAALTALDAANWCLSRNSSTVSRLQVYGSSPPAGPFNPPRGLINAVRSEWGSMSEFPGSGFMSGFYWTTDSSDGNLNVFVINVLSGFVGIASASQGDMNRVLCRLPISQQKS